MREWGKRSEEIAHLLNPAFCCTLLTTSVVSYESVNKSGMPFPIVFMIIPITLNKSTRDALPKTIRKPLLDWIQDNPQLSAFLYDQIMAMKPFTQEALIFGLYYNWLSYDKGILKSNIKHGKISQYLKEMKRDALECMKKSQLVGKWFASAGSVETVMSMWRIKP